MHGIKFSADDKVSFGGILDHGTAITVPTKAMAKVPNALPGETGIWLRTDTGNDGNALPFTIDGVADGDPIILEVSPNQGPKGQYLTISGANFGNTQGQLKFYDGLTDFDGDFTFPLECSDSYWQDGSIVVKVPDSAHNGNVHQIQVTRSGDSKKSNLYDFDVTNGVPGPGLCKIDPDNGPANDSFTINLYGDNFSTHGPGDTVYFFDGSSTTTLSGGFSSWANDEIHYKVPIGAISGPVIVKQNDASNEYSNALSFAVGTCSDDNDCSIGDECCIQGTGNYCDAAGTCPSSNSCEYTWTVTTAGVPFALQESYLCENNLQSPSPWPDNLDGHESKDAYIDTNIVGLFTKDVKEIDFDNTHIQVWKCNTGGDFDDVACTVATTGNITVKNLDTSNEGFVFDPDVNLSSNTWYKVELGEFYSEVDNDYWDGSTYDWHFRTQAALCQVDHIVVTPQSPAADIYVQEDKDFEASPIGDNCNICGGSYAWDSWAMTDLNDIGKASFIEFGPNPANTSRARLTGLQVTEHDADSRVEFQANLGNPYNLDNTTYPKIKAGLELVGEGPSCNESCSNAVVWARFNTEIDDATLVDLANMKIQKCNDATCSIVSMANLTNNLELRGTHIVDAEHLSFDPETWYQVTIKTNGIKNTAGYDLDNKHTWQFQTSGDEDCTVDRIEVDPAYYPSIAWSENIHYTATPFSAPNSCSATGVALLPGPYTWGWSSSDTGVATVTHHAHIANAQTQSDGTTNIESKITAGPDGVGINNFGILDVSQSTVVPPAAPKILEHAPTNPPLTCINAATVVKFDMRMDNTSLTSGIQLYEEDPLGGPPNCLFSGGAWWCPVSGDISTRIRNNQTIATYHPDDILQKDHRHLAIVHGAVRSLQGVNLLSSEYNFDFDGDTIDDSYMWKFTTNDQVCQVSFVTVDQHPDLFTCSRNDCPDDVNGVLNGNQHEYVAAAYDATGLELTMDSYNWVEHSGLLTLQSNIGVSIQATANNDNGMTDLLVEASDALAGSATGYSRVTLNLCENTWPLPDLGFPYEFPNTNDFNFSTYYCQDSGVGGDGILPYLADPIIKGVNGTTLGEYVFVVNPTVAVITDNSQQLAKQSWWSKLISKLRHKVLAVPAAPNPPSDLEMTSNSGDGVKLNWTDNSADEEAFRIYRKSEHVDWMEIAEVPVNVENFMDTSIIAGQIYSYRVAAWRLGINGLSDYSNTITITANASAIDVIGVRVMANTEHLSVQDWYQKYAPNSGVNGQAFMVDGYQALQVGNTVYISAANVDDVNLDIYTNIYIISHNIGARESTREIFSRMLTNMNLSINIISPNVCQDDIERLCASNFDCLDLADNNCNASELKLRRDTQRLNDLLNIKGRLDFYGQLHRSCDNNSNISCTEDDQCPTGGECVPYYPVLNSGTYINGVSITRWPSWNEEFAQTLMTASLPVDPINRFTSCPDENDPDTCWDDLNRQFYCSKDSSLYLYNKEANVDDYSLDANFEFNGAGMTFATHLFGPAIDPIHNRIQFNNDEYCQDINMNGGGSSGISCGNGIVEHEYFLDENSNGSYNPPEPFIDENSNGVWDEEVCDGGFRNLCDTTISDQNWWNEHIGGCYPPGTLDGGGDLIECTWYEPDPILTVDQCGNYCGDGDVDVAYELCEDPDDPNGEYNGIIYTCSDPLDIPTCNTCQPICSDWSLAMSCGDGFWDSAGGEQCDLSDDPNGLAGWSCSLGGTLTCDSCRRTCDNGDPYEGSCNDGNIDTPFENCEPDTYAVPTGPDDSASDHQYLCGADASPQACTMTDGWCGSGQPADTAYGEECDPLLYPEPTSAQSHVGRQYSCNDPNCVFEGGYCGNGSLDIGFEECDWDGYGPISPAVSNVNNQYSCNDPNCVFEGGYCGDGNDTGLGEDCDWLGYGPVLPVDSNVNNQYECGNNASGVDACQYIGGYCGDGDINGPETCEGATASCVEAGFIAGAATCTACSIDNTAACCDINALNAKFMADDDYELFVNGTSIGTGSNWQECGGGGDDNKGACEFHLDIDLTTDRNVVAFHAWDTDGGQQGVIGSFSCQSLSCQSVCYKGADAGDYCSTNIDCEGDPADPNDNGTCVHPGPSSPVSPDTCNSNIDCGFDNIDTPGNERWHDGDDPGGDWEHKPSLCLPGDYGIVTNTTGLWTCTNVAPGGDWNSDPDYPDAGWSNVHVSSPGGAWDNPNHPSYWKHMVPGADIIWVVPGGTDTEVWCRYVIEPS